MPHEYWGAVGVAALAGLAQLGCRPQQARRGTEFGEQLGDGRGERDLLGPARVDAAEQRIDQPVGHRRPHPVGDETPDGDVLGERGLGQFGLVRDLLSGFLAEHIDRARRVGRHAHHRRRDGTDPIADPEPGRSRCRMHQVVGEPDRTDQVHRFRSLGQDGLGAQVHRDAFELGGQARLAAQPWRRLENGDPRWIRSARQRMRRSQSADPAPDNHHRSWFHAPIFTRHRDANCGRDPVRYGRTWRAPPGRPCAVLRGRRSAVPRDPG